MQKKRILLVDDEASFTRLLKLQLEQTKHFEVRIANWAEDALPIAREFQPDLVLLDVIMPRFVGGDVAAFLRADDRLRHVPILFLTAAVSKRRVEEHEGMISGFPILAKPASFQEVLTRIEQVLRSEPAWEPPPHDGSARADEKNGQADGLDAPPGSWFEHLQNGLRIAAAIG